MLTHYRQAVFTGDDKYIVALRFLHLIFWSADDYKPVKVLSICHRIL